MAYILWKFFRKRYSKVRRSIYNSSLPTNAEISRNEDLSKDSSLPDASEEALATYFDSPSNLKIEPEPSPSPSFEVSCRVVGSRSKKKRGNAGKHPAQVQVNKEIDCTPGRLVEIRNSRPGKEKIAPPPPPHPKEESAVSSAAGRTDHGGGGKSDSAKQELNPLPSPVRKGKKNRGPRRNHKRKGDKEFKGEPSQSPTFNIKRQLQGKWVSGALQEEVIRSPANPSATRKVTEESRQGSGCAANRQEQVAKTKDLVIEPACIAKNSDRSAGFKAQPLEISSPSSLPTPPLPTHCLENQVELRKKCNEALPLESGANATVTGPALSPAVYLPEPSDHVLSLYLVKPEDIQAAALLQQEPQSPLPPNNKKRNDVYQLVESALSSIYSPSVKCLTELVRQARDVLVCCYQGNLSKFKKEFLYPAAALLSRLKSEERKGASGCPQVEQDGWPLVVHNTRITVHLGEADTRLKVGDFYLCVCKGTTSSSVELKLKYRSSSLRIQEHVIADTEIGSLFTMDWLQSFQVESTSDEQLTTLLQHMLVAVEKGIDRIKWEVVARPHSCIHGSLLDLSSLSEEKSDAQSTSTDGLIPCDRRHSCPNETIKDSTSIVNNAQDLESSHLLQAISNESVENTDTKVVIEKTNAIPSNIPCSFQRNNTSSRIVADLPINKSVSVTVKDSSAQTSPTKEFRQVVPTDSVTQKDASISSPMCSPLTDSESMDNERTKSNETKLLLKCSQQRNSSSTSTPGKETDSTKKEEAVSLSTQASQEQDDGYHDSCLIQPASIKDISPELINLGVAISPGCRDNSGHSVVILNLSQVDEKSASPSSTELAQLILYYHSILRKEISKRGLTVLVDTRNNSQDLAEFVDDVFSLVEGNISGAIQLVLLYKGSIPQIKMESLSTKTFNDNNSVKYEHIANLDHLTKFISTDQLPANLGGTYDFDLHKWQEFRKLQEPFVEECRSCGRKLVSIMQGLKTSRLPPTSALTSQLMDEHKQKLQQIFESPQLVRLQKDGIKVLKEIEDLQSLQPHNADLRDALDCSQALFNELQRATLKLSRLSEKRLFKLEQALQLRSFEEDTSQILLWLCKKGDETLKKHKILADNLVGIQTQERNFEKFYFMAMRNIEKGHDLLEEASNLSQASSKDLPGMKDLTKSLKNHLHGFSERLEDTRERLEDTSKCYQMLDRAYEWALEAMKFVSRIKMEQDMTASLLDQHMKTLQNYLNNNPPLSEDVFSEMILLATKLKNERLLEQCKVAQARCQETIDLIQTRQSTFLKARIQIDANNMMNTSECLSSGGSDMNLNLSSNGSWTSPPSNLLFPFTRRRSIAGIPSSGCSISPGYVSQGYSSFFRETYHLDSYISENDEHCEGEEYTPRCNVASVSYSSVDPENQTSSTCESSVNSSNETVESPSAKHSDNLNASPKSVSTTSCTSLHHHSKPHKKYMRRSQTWQFEYEPWQKATSSPLDAVYRMHKDFDKGSLESIHTAAETDDHSQIELMQSPSLNSNKVCAPVSVNSHLHNRGSALSLQFTSLTDSETPPSDIEIKQKRTIMLIMSEMLQTERDYVNSLEYTIENYIPELLREDIPQALRGKRNVIFGNMEKIYEFHSQYFLRELEKCERTPFRVGQCFLNFEQQFYLYALYNKNKPKSDDLMLEYGSRFFKTKQCQLGDKMDLCSYLLKPVQRMGKYALLLKQLLKECHEKEPEYIDLKSAEDMVKFQLRHGNDLLAMDCIRECDVDLKEQGRLLRQDEFLIFQGKSRKCLRHVFLFEELIVFSKARRNPSKKGHDVYQYKNSVKMSDIGMTEKVGESNTKFEIWFRKCKLNDTYSFQAPNNEIKQSWVQEISKLLWKQALRNRELRLAEMSSMGIGNKPCLDIKPSQDQISDRSVSVTQLTRGPKFRNSIAVISTDQTRNNKRPHSIISVSSSSSGSSQSSCNLLGALNLGFDPADSPKLHHRSMTQQSQCSAESGIVPDISIGYESFSDIRSNKKLEHSNSNASSDSADSKHLSISSENEDSLKYAGSEVSGCAT